MCQPVCHVLQKAKLREEERMTMGEMRKTMPPCPICGAEAFLDHDVIDGFDFGYMAGCPTYHLDDGIHGFSEPYNPDAPRVEGYSAKDVYDKWVSYCERMNAR